MSHEKATEVTIEIIEMFRKYDFNFYDMIGVLESTKLRLNKLLETKAPEDCIDRQFTKMFGKKEGK